MIVPQNRLLFWTGMIIIPFSVLAALLPEQIWTSLLSAGALLATVLIDAYFSPKGLAGITVDFSQVYRLSRCREGAISFIAENKNPNKRNLRIGLAFPAELPVNNEELTIPIPGNGRYMFEWRCAPVKRGSYAFENYYLEGTSPLGFWAVRRSVPCNFRINVYPDLLTESKNLAALFLSRGNYGIHPRRQVGQGREFEKLREYVHGDSYDHIHWKATAKRGQPVTKIFQIERTQEVYIIIDASRLSARNPGDHGSTDMNNAESANPVTIMERFVTGALVLASAAQRQGDLFGLLTFSSGIRNFLRPKNGVTHYNNCREALYTVHPDIVNPDFGELFSFIGMRLRKRALLIFLTSLDDPALSESFVKGIEMISGKHLIMVNMLRPAGVAPLFSDPDVSSVDDIYRALGGHLIWNDLTETGKTLERRGALFSLLDNEKMCVQMVSQYMDIKQRQLL
jgi:uncharacterized protein (DUF58 family)